MAVRISATGQHYEKTPFSLGSTNTWSISCWVKIGVDRNFSSTVWSLGSSASDSYSLRTDTTGTNMYLWDSGTALAGSTLTVGTWYHFGVSVLGATGTMVYRAVGDPTSTLVTWSTGGPSTTASSLLIGESIGGGDTEWINGSVAAFKVWVVAITRAELDTESWVTAPVRTTNLRAYYPFNVAETTDYSGIGQTLAGGTGATTEAGPFDSLFSGWGMPI